MTPPVPSGTGSDLGVPRPVRWSADGRAIELLDQTLLPLEERYLHLEDASEVADAIRGMKVRGAPALGIAAAMGLALGMERALESIESRPGEGLDADRDRAERDGGADDSDGADDPADVGGADGGDRRDREGSPGEAAVGTVLRERLTELRALLLDTRPTGRNLEWALDRLERRFDESGVDGGSREEVEAAVEALRTEADAIRSEDEEMCRRIGAAGLDLLPPDGGGVLTHCNAGALATGGLGTALAPLYMAREAGRPVRVYASETRPVLQGARLTAWELGQAGIRATVVSDLATGALMKEGAVRTVIVGADRVAANGDVANKIGTYALAVLADHHGIPFYVAAPRTTFDPDLPSGREITIEERDGSELRGVPGRETAPAGAEVWNPAFDVTPAHLVTAFVTDGGVLRPPYEVAIADLLDEGEAS